MRQHCQRQPESQRLQHHQRHQYHPALQSSDLPHAGYDHIHPYNFLLYVRSDHDEKHFHERNDAQYYHLRQYFRDFQQLQLSLNFQQLQLPLMLL
jgi:hypothetical protein